MLLIIVASLIFPHSGFSFPSNTKNSDDNLISKGWSSSGWPSVPSSTIGASSSSISSLAANQTSDSATSIVLNASGQGMNINYQAINSGFAAAQLSQDGSDANLSPNGEVSATGSYISGITVVDPQTEVLLNVNNADTVEIVAANHAVGIENVDLDADQYTQAINIQTHPGPSGSGWKREP